MAYRINRKAREPGVENGQEPTQTGQLRTQPSLAPGTVWLGPAAGPGCCQPPGPGACDHLGHPPVFVSLAPESKFQMEASEWLSPTYRLEPWLPGNGMENACLLSASVVGGGSFLHLPQTHRMRRFSEIGSRLRCWVAENDESTMLLFLIT